MTQLNYQEACAKDDTPGLNAAAVAEDAGAADAPGAADSPRRPCLCLLKTTRAVSFCATPSMIENGKVSAVLTASTPRNRAASSGEVDAGTETYDSSLVMKELVKLCLANGICIPAEIPLPLELRPADNRRSSLKLKLKELDAINLIVSSPSSADGKEERKLSVRSGSKRMWMAKSRSERGRGTLLSDLLHAEEANLQKLDESELSKEYRAVYEKLKLEAQHEVRVENGSFSVPVDSEANSGGRGNKRIKTVFDTRGGRRRVSQLFKRYEEKERRHILKGINLCLEAGNMYLVLGSPGSGKSSLLKMIAGLLREGGGQVVSGDVTVNGANSKDKDIVWPNIVSYVDQIDRLHSYLTVKETLDFSWQCRHGGTHRRPTFDTADKEIDALVERLDKEEWFLNVVMRAIGLGRVKDTFVGDDGKVRGVSGGERKRVTVGEIVVVDTPVQCLDEISTGLDAATTFDIIRLLGEVTHTTKTIKVVSLLQPPPETVALFNEVIVMDKGRIIFAGPTGSMIKHFTGLGYHIPEQLDTADWIQTIPTKDGAKLLVKTDEDGNPIPQSPDAVKRHKTNEEFVSSYEASKSGRAMFMQLGKPINEDCLELMENKQYRQQYWNSGWKGLKINLKREMLLRWRDKYQRNAKLAQDIIMGLIVGSVFYQIDDPQTLVGVVFQSVLFICMGAMLDIEPQIGTRGIFYKEMDSNFYPAWSFVLARILAGLPTFTVDTILYGSIVYWMSGLAYNEGASIANFLVFLLVMLVCAITTGIMFSILSATIKDKPSAQAGMTMVLVFMILFSGFVVQPDVIPVYYKWIYWMNIFAWVIRALVVNEYRSGKYDDIASDGNTTGELILDRFGFTFNDEPFEYVWVWYSVLFCAGIAIAAILITVYALKNIRFATGLSLSTKTKDDGSSQPESGAVKIHEKHIALPVKKVTLTFKDICYAVTASTSNEKLELLKGVSGFFEAGKMTALMGSSGAGKTTLLDVLALRKFDGDITGEVRLNGHEQNERSFRRFTGYVEQFDVQSPQLTIRETVEFSANLRLESSIPSETKSEYIDQVLEMLELKEIEGSLVGSDSTGGLSFEQKKRLSIAVELAANPSILFLDEPTSGLDARAAGIVMRGLKRIAEAGIAVVATIHQPSMAIFNEFDSLLLLKRGGETVYYGDLGDNSSELIAYLQDYEATEIIRKGENPATWMLTSIGAGASSAGIRFDYASAYGNSIKFDDCLDAIDEINSKMTKEDEICFETKYAATIYNRWYYVYKRMRTIYLRSPGYNRTRLVVAVFVALVFGSVFARERTPKTEGDMNSRITVIFITGIGFAVNSMNTVLPLYEMERNMFYRHKASLMYSEKGISVAFTLAEFPFIILTSTIFCVIFYFLVGFTVGAEKFFLYLLFMTMGIASFTFIGEAFSVMFRDSQTAQGFGGVLIGMCVIFCGILIRPQNIPTYWKWVYWLMPLHYILEGLIASQFYEDETPIEPSTGSPFYMDIFSKCEGAIFGAPLPDNCVGTAEDWVNISFGGEFSHSHLQDDVLYLVALTIVVKIISYIALVKLNYLKK